MAFDPPSSLTMAFVALTLGVVAADVWLVRRAAPAEATRRWTTRALALAAGWLALHAGVAASGVLAGQSMPPPLMIYVALTLLLAIALAASPVGRRLAALPLGLLVGLHAFRLPLELILHALYRGGDLPVQMTWSGLNFDVITGVTALLLGLWALRRPLPTGVVWAFNALGTALLVAVAAIAATSAPTPLRQFTEGPPVVLPLVVPYNWIVNVHVWTALVGHLVLWRALFGRRVPPDEAPIADAMA